MKPYKQLGKHRKKCRMCGKLIQDGEMVDISCHIKEQVYPVKGIMRFATYYFTHDYCM